MPKQRKSLFPQIVHLVLPILYSSSTMAASAPPSLPQVDFSRMGTVGLGGSFSGLDWWSSDSPFASGSTSAYSSNGDTLLFRGSDGSIRPIGSTNTGGNINTVCFMTGGSGNSGNGTVFVGGSFSSIGSTSSSNLAIYDLSTSTFKAPGNGLSGVVDALYCDGTNNQVWIGGNFTAPTGSGGNVALWSTTSSNFITVPFGGLNGPVMDISPSTNGSSLYFSGSFTTLYQSNSTRNNTNITSIPSAPGNTSTVGVSGYLTPVTFPPVSTAIGNLTISAGPSSDQSQYSDPNVLLCPGSGTWLARDGSVASVDVMGYNYFRALGARVSNGLVEGRGATTFCITSLPDNTQLNMTYTDPTTGKNATCWEHCPLSTDPSITAQDFIFTDGARSLTGLQMQLKTWIGDGAGLNSVQLLSDGAYSSASEAANTPYCKNANASSAQTTGNWETKTIATNIPATLSYYLAAQVPTNAVTYPSTTFYPFVSSAGYYNVYIVIPGCTQTQDCDSRTTLDIEVFPLNGGLGWTSTISEQVQDDTKTLVYSGPMDATTSSFSPTVILALSKNPASVTSDHYTVVAQAVQLTLTGTSITGPGTNGSTTINSTSSTNSSSSVAFGVFEYIKASTNTSINAATSQLPNTTETALTKLGFALGMSRNMSSSRSSWSVNAITALDNTVFVAGNFSANGNYSNIVSVDTTSGQISPLDSQGLNGVVHSAVSLGGYIYLGGEFTSTTTGNTPLKYLARYDPKAKAWASVGGGVDGPVMDLAISDKQLLVFGNFSHVITSGGGTNQTGGFAIWDTSSSSWTSNSVIYGTVSSGTTTAASGNTFLAGRILGSSSNPVNGFAFLKTGNQGAEISSLQGVNFASTASGSGGSNTTTSKRTLGRTILNRLSHALVPRIIIRATAPTIPISPVSAPAVLAGAFYKNGSTDITILGGNFSTTNGIGSLGFYSNNILTGPSISARGIIRTLAVSGNTLYAGGSDLNVTGVGNGLLALDLSSGTWKSGGIPSLNPPSGTNLLINTIKGRENTDTVVVGGNFATAGSLGCAGVCLWDTKAGQWSAPGSGLSAGEVRSMDFAGDAHDILFVGGSFVLPTGAVAYAASYSFDNGTWNGLGTLPGPALAIAVDDKNSSNVFAAGYSTDGAPYLSQWNGQTWTAQNASLQSGSIVSSLAFVPMSNEHTQVGSIENDRMLMVSGNLYLQGTGNVTSALYDGASWYPYLVGTSSTGTVGAASGLFWSESSFSFHIAHYLARGLVVLVAIAIATGLILLLILLFFLIAYLLRRRERKNQHPHQQWKNDQSSEVSSTHQNVFNNVQAALEQTLMGVGAGGAIAAAGAAGAANRHSRYSADSLYRDEGGAMADSGDEDDSGDEGGRETTMRYDFNGPELQPGEMSMKAGQRIVILDDVQSDEWWYARDPANGREGVVPATYVW